MKKNNFKKLVSVMIALVMVMTTFAMLPLTTSANATPAVWDGTTVDTSWVDAKTGADWDNAYEIADGADLAGWSKLSNETIGRFDGKYFKLTADIDLGSQPFTPIVGGVYNATGKAEVSGGAIHLDGQNFKIKNMKIVEGSKYAIINGSKFVDGVAKPNNPQVANQYASGLFANLGDNSEVRNLHFVGADINNTGDAVAASAVLVGYGSMKNCTFWNISIDETSVIQKGGSVGALIAMVCDNRTDGADSDVTVVRYCVNKASLTQTGAGSRFGGLIGTWQAGTDLDVDYCANLGTMTTTTTGPYMGGLVGTGMNDGNGTNKKQNMSFKNCYNTGSMIGEGQTGGHQSGMVGDYRFLASSTLTFENCYDYSVRVVAAGFTGQLFAIGAASNDANIAMKVTMKNCYAAPKTGSATTSTGTPVAKSDFAAYNNDFGTTAQVALTEYRALNLVTENAVVNSYMVASATAAIVTDVENNTTSTIEAEIARINAAIADLTPVDDGQGGGDVSTNPYDNGWGKETLDYSWYYTAGALVDKGTEAAPYEIASGAQLAALSALTNARYTPADVGETGDAVAKDFAGKYFKLTADIDLQGKAFLPIVAGAIVFDGNNKTISNLKVAGELNAALFGSLGAGAEVKNLKFVGADVDGLSLASVLCASASNDLTVYNVHIDATSTVDALAYGAGFVARINDGSQVTDADPKEVKFTFCSTKAAVTGASNVAGFIAYFKSNGNATFDYCTNEGSITATSPEGSPRVAGIVANCSDVDNFESISLAFTNCYNKGKLTYSITANEYSFCAGIVARLWTAESGCDLLIYNCYDYSERDVASTQKSPSNSAFMGSAKSGMIKDLDICYAANPMTSLTPYSTVHSANVTAELTMGSVVIVDLIDSQIINQYGNVSTMAAEMAKIDTAIATLTAIPEEEPTTTPTEPTEPTEPGEDTTTVPADTTTTEAPAEEKKGCKSSVSAMYAVLALTAIVGCAFVAKRKEEN